MSSSLPLPEDFVTFLNRAEGAKLMATLGWIR